MEKNNDNCNIADEQRVQNVHKIGVNTVALLNNIDGPIYPIIATYVKGHLSGVIVLSGNPAFGDTSPPAFEGVGIKTDKVAIKVVVHMNVVRHRQVSQTSRLESLDA